MHDNFWLGAQIKHEYAFFHLRKMQQSIQRVELDGWHAAIVAGQLAVVDTGWQRSIYAHFDALLSAARSIPEIIECCFGKDKMMNNWLKTLSADELSRRTFFHNQFALERKAFCDHQLSTSRKTSMHRRGYADVKVTISGRFGITHEGGPTALVPSTETPQISDPSFPPALIRRAQVEPHYNDFTINGKPLFEVCNDYLSHAGELIAAGREFVDQVHGGHPLSFPPDA